MQVTIYTKESCPYCTKAKMLLTNKNISYNEMKLNEDFTRETLLEMFPQAKTFPIIVVDGFNIGGYEQLNQKLMEETNSNQKFLIEG
jgi:glutaredoxin